MNPDNSIRNYNTCKLINPPVKAFFTVILKICFLRILPFCAVSYAVSHKKWGKNTSLLSDLCELHILPASAWILMSCTSNLNSEQLNTSIMLHLVVVTALASMSDI